MNTSRTDQKPSRDPVRIPARQGLLAILIDPDAVRRERLQTVLDDQEVQTGYALDIEEACTIAARLGPPDLVISDDAALPDLANRVCAGNRQPGEQPCPYYVAVIDDRRHAFQAMADGADDFLCWQDNDEDLATRLRAILRQATLRAWMDAIRKAGAVVSGARRFDGLFSAVATRLRQILPLDHFVVARAENGDVRFEVVDMVSNASTPWNFCLRTPRAEVCPDRFEHTESGYRVCDQVRDRDPRLSGQMQSCLCIPLWDDGRLVGSLSLASREPAAFEKIVMPHLGSLAVQVGNAVTNIERYEQALGESERLATIVREVHHRIKNNLQGVVGLLAQHREHAPQLAAILNNAISQLHTVAEVHNLLSHHAREQVNLHELIRALVQHAAALCVHRVEARLAADTESLVLTASEAVPFALVVNELIQNAIKHGYPDRRAGTIRVGLSRNEGGRLSVSNDGVPPYVLSTPDPASSLGLQLVHALLPPRCQFHLTARDGWTVAAVTLRGWVENV